MNDLGPPLHWPSIIRITAQDTFQSIPQSCDPGNATRHWPYMLQLGTNIYSLSSLIALGIQSWTSMICRCAVKCNSQRQIFAYVDRPFTLVPNGYVIISYLS